MFFVGNEWNSTEKVNVTQQNYTYTIKVYKLQHKRIMKN